MFYLWVIRWRFVVIANCKINLFISVTLRWGWESWKHQHEETFKIMKSWFCWWRACVSSRNLLLLMKSFYVSISQYSDFSFNCFLHLPRNFQNYKPSTSLQYLLFNYVTHNHWLKIKYFFFEESESKSNQTFPLQQ